MQSFPDILWRTIDQGLGTLLCTFVFSIWTLLLSFPVCSFIENLSFNCPTDKVTPNDHNVRLFKKNPKPIMTDSQFKTNPWKLQLTIKWVTSELLDGVCPVVWCLSLWEAQCVWVGGARVKPARVVGGDHTRSQPQCLGEGTLLPLCNLTSALKDRNSFALWTFRVGACGR